MDASSVTSEHIKFASPVIITPLSLFFTAVLRHGHMPQCSVIVPVPKGKKDPSKSLNYRPMTLSSSFSKILERLFLSNYQSFLTTSSLQFGFKTGSSTTLCSATVKNIMSRYTHNGSSVLGRFLDASKAFDLVDHFQDPSRTWPSFSNCPFFFSWYSTQKMQVRWGSCLSDS